MEPCSTSRIGTIDDIMGQKDSAAKLVAFMATCFVAANRKDKRHKTDKRKEFPGFFTTDELTN